MNVLRSGVVVAGAGVGGRRVALSHRLAGCRAVGGVGESLRSQAASVHVGLGAEGHDGEDGEGEHGGAGGRQRGAASVGPGALEHAPPPSREHEQAAGDDEELDQGAGRVSETDRLRGPPLRADGQPDRPAHDPGEGRPQRRTNRGGRTRRSGLERRRNGSARLPPKASPERGGTPLPKPGDPPLQRWPSAGPAVDLSTNYYT